LKVNQTSHSGVLTVWVTQVLNLRLQGVVGCEVQMTSV